jgi:hypothetical protein
MNSTPRTLLVIAAVAFAIATPASQALLGYGLSASEFASQGDGTLRAAGWAFSIWSLIYAGLVAYGIYQALPRNRANPLLDDVGLPSAAAIAGCGAWILASAFDLRWLSVAIIVGSAAILTLGLVKARRRGRAPARGDRLFVWWPLGLLAGWLTIAASINIITVLTAEGLLDAPARPAALAGVAVVVLAAVLGLRATNLAAYGLPIAWGLTAVWAAEMAAKGEVALAALAGAVLVGAYALWQARPIAARR